MANIDYSRLSKAERSVLAECLYELAHDAHEKAMTAMIVTGDPEAEHRYRYRSQAARSLAYDIDQSSTK